MNRIIPPKLSKQLGRCVICHQSAKSISTPEGICASCDKPDQSPITSTGTNEMICPTFPWATVPNQTYASTHMIWVTVDPELNERFSYDLESAVLVASEIVKLHPDFHVPIYNYFTHRLYTHDRKLIREQHTNMELNGHLIGGKYVRI